VQFSVSSVFASTSETISTKCVGTQQSAEWSVFNLSLEIPTSFIHAQVAHGTEEELHRRNSWVILVSIDDFMGASKQQQQLGRLIRSELINRARSLRAFLGRVGTPVAIAMCLRIVQPLG
jgi:hypothetical protein